MSDSNKKKRQSDDYFIPDLCREQGLLSLLVIAGLLSVFMTLVRTDITGFNFLVLGKIALEIFWISLLSAVFLCQGRRYLIHLSLPYVASINYFFILLAATISAAIIELLSHYLLTGTWQLDFLPVFNMVLITAIPAGVILRLLYFQHQLRQQQRANQEARIEALQAKIRPHFLFNSMNSLASLIRVDPDKAEQIVENLCDLFRYALNDTKGSVSLQQEVDACEQYLEIEKLRLDERLQYEWDITVDLNKIRVPALILQPLIENAVFHGIQPAFKGGYLKIKIYPQGEWICIEVVNSLQADVRTTSGNNLAVNNLRHRLDAFFYQQAELQQAVEQNEYRTRMRFKPAEG